jgi:hypothetical protein
MKKVIGLFLIIASLLAGSNSVSQQLSLPEILQSISVTVDTPVGYGAGVAFTRKDATLTNDVTFIWTAAHIVRHNDMLQIFTQEETPPRSVPITFSSLKIVQPIVKNGVTIEETNKTAKIIKISAADEGEDLALLMLNGKFFNTNTVRFDISGKIPVLGTPVYHIGSPSEKDLSFSTGVIAFVGRVLGGRLYDQTTCTVFPGSSGGGVFNTTNGLCIGLVLRMSAPGINHMIPIRVMQKWAKDEGVEWALNPNLPMPNDKYMFAPSQEDIIKHPGITNKFKGHLDRTEVK